MGKVEIGIYFCVTADILTKVFLKCFWSSPVPTIWIFSKSLILIGGHGNRKAKFSKNKTKPFKNLLLRSHMGGGGGGVRVMLKLCIHVHKLTVAST